MTKNKQIIIHSIDVSECEHITYKDSLNPMCGNTGICCYGRRDCYFKQLKREKQNSQEARDTAIKEFNRAEKLNTLLKRKEQECEKLKQTLAEIKEITEKVYNDCDNCYRDTDTNCNIDCIDCTLGGKAKLAEQILQKISECEVEDD